MHLSPGPLGGGESFQFTLEIENWTNQQLVFDAIELHFEEPPNHFFAGGIRITPRGDEGVATTILYGKELRSAASDHETPAKPFTIDTRKGQRLTKIPSGPVFAALSFGSSPVCITLLSKGKIVDATQCGTLPSLATVSLATDLQPGEKGERVDFYPGDGGSEAVGGKPTARLTQSPALTLDPQRLYDSAYNDFLKNNCDQALQGFREHLESFPATELSDNAAYWIGECYYRQRRYDQAVKQFDSVLSRYPRSEKLASALLKKGYALEELGYRPKAVEQLTQLIQPQK